MRKPSEQINPYFEHVAVGIIAIGVVFLGAIATAIYLWIKWPG